MRFPRFRAFAVAMLAMLVVTSAAGIGGPVGSAVAEPLFQDCDWTDSAIMAMWNGIVKPNEDGTCRFNPSDVDSNDRVDLYSGAASAGNNEQRVYDSTLNRLQDTEAVAGSKAKIAIVHALNAGKSEAVAHQWASENVSDFYTVMEMNMIEQINASITHTEYIAEAEFNSTGSRAVWVNIFYDHLGDVTRGFVGANDTLTFQTVNGTNVTVRAAKDTAGENIIAVPKGRIVSEAGLTGDGSPYYTQDASTGSGYSHLKATVSDGQGRTTTLFDSYKMYRVMNEVQQQESRMQDGLLNYTQAVYSAYNAGDLNASDILDPTTIYQEASTELDSTGYQGWAAIQLSALGYSGNVSASHTVTVTDTTDGATTTLNGTLFYTGSDVANFTTGTTYTLANLSGSVIMAAQGANSTAATVDLANYGHEFVIDAATNTKTGEQMNITEIDKKTYGITTADQLQAELNALSDLRAEYEAQLSSAGASDDSSGFSAQTVVLVALLAAVAVMYKDR